LPFESCRFDFLHREQSNAQSNSMPIGVYLTTSNPFPVTIETESGPIEFGASIDELEIV
jgi:hypothetical protein